MAETGHLSDLDIQALLDKAIDGRASRVARAHLAGCRECRRRVEVQARLFAAIETWEEVAPAHDITPAVVRSLKGQRTPKGLRAATAVQAGLAVIITVMAWPVLARLLSSFQAPSLPALDLAWLGGFAAQVQESLRFVEALSGSLGSWLPIAPPAMALWPAIIAGALLLAILGNSILLAGDESGRRRIQPRRS